MRPGNASGRESRCCRVCTLTQHITAGVKLVWAVVKTISAPRLNICLPIHRRARRGAGTRAFPARRHRIAILHRQGRRLGCILSHATCSGRRRTQIETKQNDNKKHLEGHIKKHSRGITRPPLQPCSRTRRCRGWESPVAWVMVGDVRQKRP